MKKIISVLALVAVLFTVSCSSKDRRNSESFSKNDSEVISNQADDVSFNKLSDPQRDIAEILDSINEGNEPTEEQVNQMVSYIENNAKGYFRALHNLYSKMESALQNQDAAEMQKVQVVANSFDAQWDNYSLSLQILANMDSQNMLTEEQHQRLEAFGDDYAQGLQEFGALLTLAQSGEAPAE